MAYIYVYAPCTGTSGPQSTYCNGTAHTVVSCIGGSSPLDVMTFAIKEVWLHATSLAPMCKTTQCNGVCATAGAPWTYGIKVDLYLDFAATQYLGTVGYGHVENRIANGTYDCRSGLKLGTLPRDCACGCSSGIHCHMQGNGTAQSFGNCTGTALTKGSTWIYRWLANV
jgi:hypothetical protein